MFLYAISLKPEFNVVTLLKHHIYYNSSLPTG